MEKRNRWASRNVFAVLVSLIPAIGVWADLSIPLPGLSSANHKFTIGDLDGDKKFDFVVCETVDRYTDTGWFWAFSSDGRFLWKVQVANRQSGYFAEFSHPWVCYDLDGDGKEEPYTKLNGKLAKLDPMTGKVVKQGEWPATSGRMQMIVAYLDGVNPFLVVSISEGSTVWAYKKDMSVYWKYSSSAAGYPSGSHNLCQGDVDGDGKDEISLGKCIVDHDGKPLWKVTTGNHCDVHQVADINWTNPGLEVFMQTQGGLVGLFDGKTGKSLWSYNQTVGNWGCVGDFNASYPGLECVAVHSEKDGGSSAFSATYTADGKKIGATDGKPMMIWWEGTEQQTFKSIPQTFYFQGDIMGDWREEECYIVGGTLTIKQATGSPKLNLPSLRTNRKYFVDIHRGTRGINGKYIQPLLSCRITDVGKDSPTATGPYRSSNPNFDLVGKQAPSVCYTVLGRQMGLTEAGNRRIGDRGAFTVLARPGRALVAR